VNKLEALLPLLGWFYLSLSGIFLFLFVRKRQALESFVISMILFAWMLLSIAGLKQEILLAEQGKPRWTDSWQSKIHQEIGSMYQTYFEVFHPLVPRGALVHLFETSTLEFHVARMYLYPASVIQAGFEREYTPVYAVVGEADANKLQNGEVLARVNGKILMKLGEK
jgi:hypothetical protein